MQKNTKAVLNKLEARPEFRERRNKNRGIAMILIKRYPDLKNIHQIDEQTMHILTEIVKESQSLDRAWRKLLADDESLRGTDYEEGYKLAVKAMDELGYKV